MTEYEFWTQDRALSVRISGATLSKMIRLCSTANTVETGGIVVGHYNKALDCALISDIYGPPKDSKHQATRFYRGIRGVQRLLEALWREPWREYYLGDWHYHPHSSATPSSEDKDQLRKQSIKDDSQCKTPIMLVIGGDPNKDCLVKIFAHTPVAGFIELFPSSYTATAIAACVHAGPRSSA